MNATDTNDPPKAKNRLSLIVLFSLFLAPVIVAALLFYVFPEWRPTGTSNHGQLVEPIRPLPAFSLQTLGGENIDETFLRGKWNLVYLAQGPCLEACVDQLYTIRQVRLATGKNIDRLQRLMFWDRTGVDDTGQAALREHFPGQVIVPVEPEDAVVDVFNLDPGNSLQAGRIYLVDPLGNLMMSYEPGAAPRGMIKDLERLLKYSGLG